MTMTLPACLRPLHQRLARFARDDSGTVLTEFVIYLPLLLWAWIALVVFWDGFRETNAAQKASFAIADMITREQSAVSDSYRNGLQTVFAYMTHSSTANVSLRFTSILYHEDNERYQVDWSYSPGSKLTELTTASLQSYVSRLPVMAGGDYLMLVETHVAYEPIMHIPFFGDYIQPRNIDNFVTIRPRYMRVKETS